MSLVEFSAMVQLDAGQIEEWTGAGLLDPNQTGGYGELDLLRLITIKHHQALGYTTGRLAEAVSKEEVEPFLAEYIYPKGPQLTLEQAAARLDVKPRRLVELRRALGWSREGYLEGDLRLLEARAGPHP